MKILFIGNTRLGDAILSTCILNHFENKNVEVTVICSPLSREIYKNFQEKKEIANLLKIETNYNFSKPSIQKQYDKFYKKILSEKEIK